MFVGAGCVGVGSVGINVGTGVSVGRGVGGNVGGGSVGAGGVDVAVGFGGGGVAVARTDGLASGAPGNPNTQTTTNARPRNPTRVATTICCRKASAGRERHSGL